MRGEEGRGEEGRLGRGEGGRGRSPPFFTSPSLLLSGEGVVGEREGEVVKGGEREVIYTWGLM